MLDEYDDPIKLYGAWGTNPPYWDQKKDGSRKLRYALWSMRFVQYLPDGAEVDHEAKPPPDCVPACWALRECGANCNLEQRDLRKPAAAAARRWMAAL